MPRFVILHHELPAGAERCSHWDLMLERPEGLQTWALDNPPEAARPVPAVSLPLHRAHYLDYQGPVSGGRGEVSQWDAGTYELLDEALERLTLRLRGRRLSGRLELRRLGPERWQAQLELIPEDSSPPGQPA